MQDNQLAGIHQQGIYVEKSVGMEERKANILNVYKLKCIYSI